MSWLGTVDADGLVEWAFVFDFCVDCGTSDLGGGVEGEDFDEDTGVEC